jgi:hypothetical protein
MKYKRICFVYFTFNRLNILKESLRSSLFNTLIKPDDIFIFDDCSNQETQQFLRDFCAQNSNLNIHLDINETNLGYAANYKKCFDIIKNNKYEYICFLETDYIWRKNYLEESLAILETEEESIGICGSSFKEFYEEEKWDTWFKNVTESQFGKDVCNRSLLYSPNVIDTKLGKIKIQYGTHSCGTFILNKKRLFDNLTIEQLNRFWQILDLASEIKNNRSVINDGMITGGISILWDEFLQKKYNGKEFKKAAFIDIIDHVIGVHVEGGGINGNDNVEGATRYMPPNFPSDYNNFKRV